MRLPGRPKNYNDLFDRIIFTEEDNLGGANQSQGILGSIGQQFLNTGNQYAKNMLQQVGVSFDKKQDPAYNNAIEKLVGGCSEILKAKNIDTQSNLCQLNSIFLGTPYMDKNGVERTVKIREFYKNKELSINLKDKPFKLYFNISDWIGKKSTSPNTLSIDSNYSTFLMKDKNVSILLKDIISKKDLSTFVDNSLDQNFNAALDDYLNGLVDKSTKLTAEGLSPTDIKTSILQYLKCVLKPLNNFDAKKSGTDINFDNKLFWTFTCLKKGVLIS